MKKQVALLAAVLFLPVLGGCLSSAFHEEYRRMLDQEQNRYQLVNHNDPLPDLSKASGVTEYVKYAALNNSGLKAAFYHWKASLEKVPQVTSLNDPRFTYTNFIEEVETRVGPQENAFAISQKFPFFGKLSARGDAAMQEAHAAYQALQAELLKVTYRVKEAYFEYYYLVQAIRLTGKSKLLMANFERIATSRFRNKLATQQDVLRAQVELGKITNDLDSLKDLEPAVSAKLSAALNRPQNAPFPRPKGHPSLKKAFPHDNLADWAIRHNPKIKELEHRIRKAEKGETLAKLNRLPDVTVGVKYIDTGSALMPGTKDSSKDPVLLSFGINLPIWLGRLRAGEREAEAQRKRAGYRRVQFEHNLRADLKMIAYRLRDARRQAQLYRDSLIPKARQTMQVAEVDYKSGKADFLSLVDSQRILLAFQLTYYRALSHYRQRLAELEKIVGAPIKQAKENR